MALRRIIPMMCLWLTILTCFLGCDETDTTEPVPIPLPPDAEEAIIFLGSSPAQTVKIGEKDADLRITPGEDELGKTNMLLVQFKGSSDDILSEVTEEVYVSKSGQTDINLQFVRIINPYIRVNLAEGEIGIKIDVKGWNFNPNEDIEIYLVARGSDVQPDTQVASATEAAWASIRLQSKAKYQNKAPGAISISADEPVLIARTDGDGHFETDFTVPSDLIYDVLAGKTFVRAVEVKSSFMMEVQFDITSPYIYVDPLTGSVGTEIAVTGLNFGANEDIQIDFGDTKEVAPTKAEADGSFSATFRIPEDAPVKRTSVQVTGLKSGYTKPVTFDVSVRDIDLDPPVGAIGSEVAVKGESFGADEKIRIDFSGNEVARVTTDAEGSFEAKFPVPRSDPGAKSIQATELGSGYKAEVQFTVFESRIYVDPPAGVVGDEATVIGSSFGANEEIRIDFGGNEVAQATTNAEGSFEAKFPVPRSDPGTKSIRVTGLDSGSEAEFPFTIPVPSIYMYPYLGVMGTEVTVIGSGFGVNEAIRIDFGSSEVAQDETDADGSFATIFEVPKSGPGAISIRVIGLDSGSGAEFPFTIPAPYIDLYPSNEGVMGNNIKVNGARFGANEEIEIKLFRKDLIGKVADAETGDSGEFEAGFTVPKGLDPGIIMVEAAGQTSGSKTRVQFLILSPAISVNPTSGVVGTSVTVRGSCFGSQEEIRIDFGDIQIMDFYDRNGNKVSPLKADVWGGEFEAFFDVPKVTEPGLIMIRATGLESDNKAEFPFTIIPSDTFIDLYPTDKGVMGNEIKVNGAGFGANEVIKINLSRGGSIWEVAETTAVDSGEFEAVFTVPKGIDPGMIVMVEAEGQASGNKTGEQFLILPCAITVNPTSGVVGTSVTVIGSGFGSQEEIRIDFGDIQIKSFYDRSGKELSPLKSDVWGGEFTAIFDVPEGVEPGSIMIRATGLESGNKAEFLFNVVLP